MLVDCFLYIWFRGLINLGGISEGKATRTVRLRYTNQGAKERQQAFLAPLPGNHRFKIQSYLHS